ncbi:MAG: hypothetical protein ACRD2U_13630 [Terriglobales bacterium]
MPSKTWAIIVLPLCLSLLTGCGGPAGCPGGIFASGGCANSNGGGGGNLGQGGSGGGAILPAVPITVQASQTTIADIAVVAPVSSIPPNVQAVGIDSNGFAFATGGTASQGEASGVVTLFGPGITSDMQVSFSGPSGDITTSNIQGVTATDGTPGLQFNIAVASTAALGARTLILQNSNNDITTFTGGIEIIP